MTNSFLTMASVAVMVASTAIAQQPSDVRTDLRSRSQLGSYVEISERYAAAAIPELIEIINSPLDVRHWENAAGVLGVIGDDRAVDALIDLIERPPVGSVYVSLEWHYGRREALRALGFLIHRTGSPKALEYLIESLDDTIWRRRELRGIPPISTTQDRYDRLLSEVVVIGLALSGDPRAGEALRSLRQSPTPNQARLREGLDDTLDTWLGEVYRLVEDRGVVGMYEYYDQKRQQGFEEAQP
jgi:hypothetical protein